jgi:hypothetical protein
MSKIHEGADLKNLSRAVIQEALRDLGGKDPIRALDALLWLTSNDFPIWADVWGFPFVDPFKVLVSGGIDGLPGQEKRKHKKYDFNLIQEFKGLSLDDARELAGCIKYSVYSTCKSFREEVEKQE